MPLHKKSQEKSRMHIRNRNKERYDIKALLVTCPELEDYVVPSKLGEDSIDFASPIAVRLLNKALLNHYYGIKHWEFPEENLCPPIPGRADYLHHIADLLGHSNAGEIPRGDNIICLDVGVGASCIYPIIGALEYGWKFIGADIDSKSIESAQKIIEANPSLHGKIECKLQENPRDVFYGVITREEQIDLTICNPPFHASIEDAQKENSRKVKNLSGKKISKPELNFGGASHELICDGGEAKFIQNMIRESKKFASNCFWFSTIVSKQSTLKGIYKSLDQQEAYRIKTIPMGTGNKSSRVVAWTFLSREEQRLWVEKRWNTTTEE